MQYRLIIFDWDGTLMNSLPKITACVQYTAEQLKLDVREDQEIHQIVGLTLDLAVSTLYPQLASSEVETFIECYRHYYVHIDQTPSELYEGARSLLSKIKNAGGLLAIASGKSRAGIRQGLEDNDLSTTFDIYRGGDQGPSKPNPDMLLKILGSLSVVKSKALMVGDTHYDMSMAKSIGMERIAISHGAHDAISLAHTNPTSIISHLSELEQFVL